jgi:hypothetical protein
MAATTGYSNSPQPTPTEPLVAAALMTMTPPKSGPLWRFALVGLGPLSALGVFALLYAFFQHYA